MAPVADESLPQAWRIGIPLGALEAVIASVRLGITEPVTYATKGGNVVRAYPYFEDGVCRRVDFTVNDKED